MYSVLYPVDKISGKVVEHLVRYVYGFPSQGLREGKFGFLAYPDHVSWYIRIMTSFITHLAVKNGHLGQNIFAVSCPIKEALILTLSPLILKFLRQRFQNFQRNSARTEIPCRKSIALFHDRIVGFRRYQKVLLG